MQKGAFVGIDEVGRGPLAGPVMVCAFWVQDRETLDTLVASAGVPLRDSKKLTERMRRIWYTHIQQYVDTGKVRVSVVGVSAEGIDREGIATAIQVALTQSLAQVARTEVTIPVWLDGGLHAPESYTSQTTVIKGDELHPVISLASIVAKVTRDTALDALALEYPEYGFSDHKGYGTKAHFEAIRQHGVIVGVHRRTYLTKSGIVD